MSASAKSNYFQQVQVRGEVLRALRTFFWQEDYLETDSPIRLQTPALEDYIDAIKSEELYLRTSPEFHMKRLLAEGFERIFQIGSCFRAKEYGDRHRSEFTMLEWYRTNADYLDILDDCQKLCRFIAHSLKMKEDYFAQEWQVLTVDEAFIQFTGKSVHEAIANDQFEEVLCFEIEPHLGKDRPTILIDYPASMAALAKMKNDDVAERWEMYINGLEIANAYSELTNAQEQRTRFEECAKLRADDQREVYAIDEEFMKALDKGIPPTGGIAVGVDRLIMAFTDTMDISEAINFSEE